MLLRLSENQAKEILYNNFKYLDIIKKIKMRSCYSLMLGFDKFEEFDFGTALFLDEDIKWLSIRKIILENMKYVNEVIEQKTLDYVENLKMVKPNYVVHGDDWKAFQSSP